MALVGYILAGLTILNVLLYSSVFGIVLILVCGVLFYRLINSNPTTHERNMVFPVALCTFLASCIVAPYTGDGYLVLKTWDGSLFASHVTLPSRSHDTYVRLEALQEGKKVTLASFPVYEAEHDGVKATRFATFIVPYRTRVWYVGDYIYHSTLTRKINGEDVVWDVTAVLLPAVHPRDIVSAASRYKSKKEWNRDLTGLLDLEKEKYDYEEEPRALITGRYEVPLEDSMCCVFEGYHPLGGILVRNPH